MLAGDEVSRHELGDGVSSQAVLLQGPKDASSGAGSNSSRQQPGGGLPAPARSRARQGGWARCFGCNVPPSLRAHGGDHSGAPSRVASTQADRWVEGSDEEIVTVHDFARHVIAAAAKRDAAAAKSSAAT